MGDIIVGIDIGTSKVCALIAEVANNNFTSILGVGTDICSGVKKGMIVDIESTSNSIAVAVKRAEEMAKIKIGSAYVNISGGFVEILNNRGIINITSENREITPRDVQRALADVKDITLPEDKRIIDIIPRQYKVDEYDEIVDPVGMVGSTLQIDANVVVGKVATVQNIIKSMERANLKIDGIIVEALASSEIALTSEEKDMGVVLVDVGGGVTNISVFENKNLIFSGIIPIGGDHITNDISLGLKVSLNEAERLKKEYELALTSLIKNNYEITIFEINENVQKKIKVSEVVNIIEARVHEIFYLTKNMLEKAGLLKEYGAGVVLVGSGISYVDGSTQIASELLNSSVRIASYKGSDMIKTGNATAIGMIKYVSTQKKNIGNVASEIKSQKKFDSKTQNTFFGKIFKVLANLF